MIGHENGRYRLAGKKAYGRPAGQPDRTDARTDPPATGKDTIENAGIRAGEIIAYRAWRLITDGPNKGKLVSMVVPYIWQPRKVGRAGGSSAEVRFGELMGLMSWLVVHNNDGSEFKFSPDGFFAFKELSRAFQEYNYATDFYTSFAPTAYGRVALWGQVIEYEMGYRAEFAKVIDIDCVKFCKGEDCAGVASDLNQLYAA